MIGTVRHHDRGKDPMFKIWHASEEAMIIFMHSDGGSIVCREKTYPIRKGVLCFVGAGAMHYTMPDPPEAYDRSKLFFPGDLIQKLSEILPQGNTLEHFDRGKIVYTQLTAEDSAEVETVFCKIEESQASLCADQIFLSACLKLLTYPDRGSAESAREIKGTMEQAIEYINQNIASALTVDDICNAVHISKYHFCRKFKKCIGLTVMNYILKTRIISAKSLLEQTSLSVTEISGRCGFSSISYFCRVFKEDTGRSPLEYRKKHCKE